MSHITSYWLFQSSYSSHKSWVSFYSFSQHNMLISFMFPHNLEFNSLLSLPQVFKSLTRLNALSLYFKHYYSKPTYLVFTSTIIIWLFFLQECFIIFPNSFNYIMFNSFYFVFIMYMLVIKWELTHITSIRFLYSTQEDYFFFCHFV